VGSAGDEQAVTGSGSDGEGGGYRIAIARAIGAPRAPVPPTLDLVSTGNGIDYHGGPVMTGNVGIYYIWYGNWNGNSAEQILVDFANNVGGSPIYRVNTSYGDNSGNVSGNAHYAGGVSVGYTHGTQPSGDDIWRIVDETLSAGSLPVDTNGVYFVLTSADVTIDGICTNFCGWHTAHGRGGKDIKYSFIGNGQRCNGSCGSASPNGNSGADGMASTIYHELSEAVSDPLINAWYDSSGEENADKCAWKFLTTYHAANGQNANVRLGNRDFLLQSNWLNANGGSCTLSGGSGPPPAGPGVLPAGGQLSSGQALVSPDGQNRAVMQSDGNFCVTQGGVSAWCAGTAGTGANHVSMQTDGNLVVYDSGNHAKWASGTNGSGADSLKMQNDGNLVVYAGTTAKWASNTNRNVGASVNAPRTLNANQRLQSSDGRFEALMQTDGNFVLYMGATPLWASGTNGSGANHAVMQSDGNLVVFDAGGAVKWSSGTSGSGGAKLTMQNDGNLVIYQASGAAVWSTGTWGH
jgi:hypothetical protein